MEFFFNILKIVGGLYLLFIVLSVTALFFKRFRKIGIWVLVVIVSLPLIYALINFTPRSYDRNYISDSEKLSNLSLRVLADQRSFYLGGIGKVADIKNPEFIKTFNSITPERDLKLGHLFKEGQIGIYDFSHADSIVNFALANNLRVRGHVLVWGKLSDYFQMPDLEVYLADFPESDRGKILKDLKDNHIKTVLNHYRGRIFNWDVVNEPLEIFGKGELEDNIYLRHLGPEYVNNAFKLAHQVDPDIKLFLNEQIMNYDGKRAEGFYQFVHKMVEDGVPIHGVGLQSHIVSDIPSLENLRIYIERFSQLGLDVELTEVDARLRLFNRADDPYQAQGEFYGQLLKVCLESPGCTGLTFWGYTDAHSWMDSPGFSFFPKPNEPYLFDKDMNPKPVLEYLGKAFE